MGILDELLGGGQRQQDYKDFINRYEQGDPSEGYTDQEVLKRTGKSPGYTKAVVDELAAEHVAKVQVTRMNGRAFRWRGEIAAPGGNVARCDFTP